MKNLAQLLFFSVLLVTFSANAEEKISLGVSLPLTGNGAIYGADIKNVLLFANEKLANNRYELIFDDDKCSSGRDAAAVAHRFVNMLKLKYVTGFFCSSSILASAQTYERAGVLVMALGASAMDVSKAGDFIFRTWSSDEGAALKLYEHISPRFKTLGILSEQTDYAQAFLSALEKANQKGTLEIVNENYLTENIDFRSLLIKLKRKKIDSLFINSQTEATFLPALKQTREMGLDVPIYGAYFPGSDSFLGKAGELADGITFVDFPSVREIVSPEGLKLADEYEARFGKITSFDLIFITAFEGFRALHQAIESGQDARSYLYSTKFRGIIGDWWFDRNGDIEGLEFVLKEIKGGKPVPLT